MLKILKGLPFWGRIVIGLIVIGGVVFLLAKGWGIKIQSPIFGSFEASPPIISVSVSAQELSSISTLSAYQANLRDRENLLGSLRNSLAPALLQNKIRQDLDLCAADASKNPSGPQLEFCNPTTVKGLQDFSRFLSTKQKELDDLSNASDRGIAAKAKVLAAELDKEKSKYGDVSYYYLLRASVESFVAFQDESILPFLYEGLGKLPNDSSLNSVLGRFLAFSGKEGSVQAAIYFLEESLRHISNTQRHILKHKLSKPDGCPLARYNKSEAVLSNAVAWLMALQGDITHREAAEVHIQRAIELDEKLTDAYQGTSNCVPPPSQESMIAYEDTRGYVLLRFGQKLDDFQKASTILKRAADAAREAGLWEVELLVRHHLREADARGKFIRLLESQSGTGVRSTEASAKVAAE
jgi:hypothetical protein